MNRVIMEVLAGTHIEEACRKAINRAKESDQPIVAFNFNGIDIEVDHNDNEASVMDQWQKKSDQRRKEYEQSDEYKKAQAESHQRAVKAQFEIGKLLTTLPNVIRSMPELMDWMYQYAENADNINIDQAHIHLVRGALLGAGYKKNHHVGRKGEWSSQQMGEYIVGQVISCLESDMPPHPVTLSFVDKYRKLKKQGK